MKNLLIIFLFASLSCAAQVTDFVGGTKSSIVEDINKNKAYTETEWEENTLFSIYNNEVRFGVIFEDDIATHQVIIYSYSMANNLMTYLRNNFVEIEKFVHYVNFESKPIKYYRVKREDNLVLIIHL